MRSNRPASELSWMLKVSLLTVASMRSCLRVRKSRFRNAATSCGGKCQSSLRSAPLGSSSDLASVRIAVGAGSDRSPLESARCSASKGQAALDLTILGRRLPAVLWGNGTALGRVIQTRLVRSSSSGGGS